MEQRNLSLADKLDDDAFLKVASTIILLPLYAVLILGALAQIIR